MEKPPDLEVKVLCQFFDGNRGENDAKLRLKPALGGQADELRRIIILLPEAKRYPDYHEL